MWTHPELVFVVEMSSSGIHPPIGVLLCYIYLAVTPGTREKQAKAAPARPFRRYGASASTNRSRRRIGPWQQSQVFSSYMGIANVAPIVNFVF